MARRRRNPAPVDASVVQAVRASFGKPEPVVVGQTDLEDGTDNRERNAAYVGGIAADRLRSIVERVERLQEEQKALADDIRDVFAEAKAAGFDVKVVRQIIRDRKKEPAELEEQETLLDLYRRALGM